MLCRAFSTAAWAAAATAASAASAAALFPLSVSAVTWLSATSLRMKLC